MSHIARSIPNAVERLRCQDPTLKEIDLHGNCYNDAQLSRLVDCLLGHPNVVTHVWLGCNQLTDQTGFKLGRYIAVSSTIQALYLNYNKFSEATYLTLAAALRVNSSLQALSMFADQDFNINDKSRVDMAFIESLILNPVRPTESFWMLYTWGQNDFPRLKPEADRFGHPTMQASLAMLV